MTSAEAAFLPVWRWPDPSRELVWATCEEGTWFHGFGRDGRPMKVGGPWALRAKV